MRGLLLLMLMACSLPVHSQIYKWTDANGKVHYSDKAVGNGEPIRMPKSQQADPQAGTRLQQFRNQLEGSRQIREEATEAAQQQAAEREHKCNLARNRLKDLKEFGQVYQIKDGERVYLDHQQKDAHMAEMQQYLSENCE